MRLKQKQKDAKYKHKAHKRNVPVNKGVINLWNL